MKLIKPSVMILNSPGWRLETIYKNIELVGRTCYKSEDKIKENSAAKFVDMLINNGHTAMLEHGTIYLYVESNPETAFSDSPLKSLYWKDYVEQVIQKYNYNKYSEVVVHRKGYLVQAYITTNYRVLLENKWMNDLKYLSPFIEGKHIQRITVKFICNRQVSHEFVRHRVFSFAQESTRYCNYTKNKFGNELTFIEPCWEHEDYVVLENILQHIEDVYFYFIKEDWKPQQAATILPNALKTELVMTGTINDWKGFFKLRADSHAHPQAQELAYKLKDIFIKKSYISDVELD